MTWISRAQLGRTASIVALALGLAVFAPAIAMSRAALAQETNTPSTNTSVNSGEPSATTPGLNPAATDQPGTVIERERTTTTTTTDTSGNWWPWLIVLGIVLLVLIIALASRPDVPGPTGTRTERYERRVDHTA